MPGVVITLHRICNLPTYFTEACKTMFCALPAEIIERHPFAQLNLQPLENIKDKDTWIKLLKFLGRVMALPTMQNLLLY